MAAFTAAVMMVTGGASGLGAGAVDLLARRGGRVWVADRVTDKAEDLARQLRDEGHDVRHVPIDVTDEASVDAAFSTVEAEAGPVTHVVTAAGINVRAGALDVSLADWQRVLNINLTGTFITAQRAAKRLKADGLGGSIVTITSMLAHYGAGNLSPYGSSKGGVAMLTRCLATEWAPLGIRVNAVSPGYIETAMTRRMLSLESFGGATTRRTPMGRFGTPEDVAKAIAFFLSDEAGFVTGTMLPVDGGIVGGDPNMTPPNDAAIAAELGLS